LSAIAALVMAAAHVPFVGGCFALKTTPSEVIVSEDAANQGGPVAEAGPAPADGSPPGDEAFPSSSWPGFVALSGLGDACNAALATDPASVYGPLTFIPCSSGETNCQELKWDGTVTWNPAGIGDLLVFDVQFVHDDQGRATRLLVRRHYPIGDGYGPNPYEAVLYDLSSGTPLAILRNTALDCFVVPVASPQGLWLAGGASRSGNVVAAYLALPDGASHHDAPTFRAVSVDASFLQGAVLAFDDRIALSQSDGKIVVATAAGGDASTYGPGQRVWLSATIGDRFLTVNDKASDGLHYFTLDRSMSFAPYGGKYTLTSDGLRIAYWQSTGTGFSIWSASASDGSSAPVQLATIAGQTSGLSSLSTFGSAMADGAYVLLTTYVEGGLQTGPITATVARLDGGGVSTGQVLSGSETDSVLPGYRQLVGYAQRSLWFAETGNSGFAKILRIKAPGT
jgi:hypothetical protein